MHCISGIIFKKELHNNYDNICHVDLPQGYVLIPNPNQISSNKITLIDNIKTFAEISTDYFGGMGDQNGNAWVDGIEIDLKIHSINNALKTIGVIKENYDNANSRTGSDEFDTINLGNYRSYEDIELEWKSSNNITSGIEYKFLLKYLPSDTDSHSHSHITHFYNDNKITEIRSDDVSYYLNDVEITKNEYKEYKIGVNKKVSFYRYLYKCQDDWFIDVYDEPIKLILASVTTNELDIPNIIKNSIIMEITNDNFDDDKLVVPIVEVKKKSFLSDYFNSPEGQKDMEEYFEDVKIKGDLLDKRLVLVDEYIKINGLKSILDRLVIEHNEEWSEKCFNRGVETHPNNKLYLLLDWVKNRHEYKYNKDIPQDFLSSCYQVGEYWFCTYSGQGVFDRIYNNDLQIILQT